MLISPKPISNWDSNTHALNDLYNGPIGGDLSGIQTDISNLQFALNVLNNESVKKVQSSNYVVTDPSNGPVRNISEDMSGDDFQAAVPTIVSDLKNRGVL
jgi:hypothetical protein